MNRHEEALLEVSKAALANSSLKFPYTAEVKQLLEELLPSIAINVQHFSIGAIGSLVIPVYVTISVSNLPAPMDEDTSVNKLNRVPIEIHDSQDFSCTLCFELFYDPVTTICGHSFCRQCLSRYSLYLPFM